MDDGAMFDDVLVLLDGSEDAARAIGPAAAIAHYLDVPLIAAGFYEGPTRMELAIAVDDQIQGRGSLKLDIVIEPLTGSVGQSVAELLASRSKGMTLICLSTHGRGRSAALVGSVASEVLDAAHSPVLLVGPSYGTATFRCHGPLVVAIDGNDDSRSILPMAQSFATSFDYELEIATVVAPKDSAQFEQLQASWAGGELSLEPAGVDHAAADAEQQMHVPVSFTVLHGANPATALTDYVTKTHATLLAMASHNPSGIERVKTGSMLANVARTAPCPILAIRIPAG
jgi:nucleotide-binding universal stress UspA family protein